MGQSNDTTLGLTPLAPLSVAFSHFRGTVELSLPTSLLQIAQCYAADTILWALDLSKSPSELHALDSAWVVTAYTILTTLVLLWVAFRHAPYQTPGNESHMGPCLPYVVGAFVIGLAIRLGKSVEGCETSPAKINATAIILTIIAMRLAGLRAGLAEPRLRSLHDAFLTPGFLAPVMIVVFMTYAQFTDFGSAADIWMFQMFPEFGFALLLDWAHIMTAVGVGGVGQGNGHVRRRRRGGGEANLPNLNAEVDGEWEYVH